MPIYGPIRDYYVRDFYVQDYYIREKFVAPTNGLIKLQFIKIHQAGKDCLGQML